jgi:hypothetical protein
MNLKQDYDDVIVRREGLCLYAKGNPNRVRMAVELAFDRICQRGVYGLDTSRPGITVGNHVEHSGDYANIWLRRM